MSGEMRRPPQLWEQRLARTTAILGVGLSSGGDTTAVVPSTPPPGSGGGVEPAPVLPAPGAFTTPAAPTLTGTVQGIRVSWNGLNANGDPYPTGAYVEIHISTTSATFTPDATTLAGTLLGSAGFFTIGALTAGTTYFVRLVGVDEAGNRTSPSTAASSQTGLTTSSDYGTATIDAGAVSFNARQIGGITTTVGSSQPTSPVAGDIWLDSSSGAIIHKRWNGSSWVTQAWGSDSISAGAITAVQIAAGAITAGAIAAGAVTADKIAASAITADKIAANAITAAKLSAGAIDGQTITGVSIRTAASGARVEMGSTFGILSSIQFFSATGSNGIIGTGFNTGQLLLSPGSGGNVYVNSALEVNGGVSGTTLNFSGAAIDLPGAAANTGATTADAGFNGNRLRAKTSSQNIKYDIATVDGTLDGVDEARQVDVVTVDPADVLTLGVAEFSWLEEGEPTDWRELGFIAQDVAAKFPIAASINADGEAIAVRDTPLIAALIAVVRQQRDDINDLRSRIEALEA